MTSERDIVRTAARVVRSSSGGPLRTIVTGRRTIPTGDYFSTKSARFAPWEGYAERDHIVVCEADPDVAKYLSQPFRLEMPVPGGAPAVYIPDMEQVLRDGSVRIVEVRGPARLPRAKDDDRRREKLRRYREKLDRAEAIFDALAWQFVVVEAGDIYREPRWANSRAITLHRSAAVPSDASLALSAFMRGRPAARYAEVADVLGGDVIGRARLHALVVRGTLSVDIDEILRPWSWVRSVDVRR